jgi:CubicO group peptidase (beta-lactamase class C family)
MTSQIPPISHVQSSSSPSGEGAIQAILDRHCKDYPKEIPVGCNLVVMQEGKPPTPFHAGEIVPDGPQNWGSTSKQFTAACIDKLVKQGKIRYDDDIRKLCPDLPEFKLDGVVQKVTVDDLLHMRSGLPEVWASALMAGFDAEHLNNTELLELLNKHPGMVFSPGSKEMYCNTNYYLLAKIVEVVSERPFIEYVRDEILAPLGMQARCSIDPSCPETIPGYDGDPSSKTYMKDVTSENRTYGTTGLIGPPSDMIKWNNTIAHRDYDLLEPPNQQQSSSESLYCRGVIAGPVDNYYRIFHGGSLAGAVTIYRRYEHRDDPRKTFAFFLATNADSVSNAEKTADDVANALAGKEIERAREVSSNPLANSRKSDAQIFSGTYRCEEFGTEWILSPKEKEPGKWAVEMITSDHKKFPRIDFDPKRDKDGHLIFQFGYGNATIERTSDGFIYHSENMAPVHFTRGPFVKYKSVPPRI